MVTVNIGMPTPTSCFKSDFDHQVFFASESVNPQINFRLSPTWISPSLLKVNFCPPPEISFPDGITSLPFRVAVDGITHSNNLIFTWLHEIKYSQNLINGMGIFDGDFSSESVNDFMILNGIQSEPEISRSITLIN